MSAFSAHNGEIRLSGVGKQTYSGVYLLGSSAPVMTSSDCLYESISVQENLH